MSHQVPAKASSLAPPLARPQAPSGLLRFATLRLRWSALELLRPYLRNRLLDKGKQLLVALLPPPAGAAALWRPLAARRARLRRGGEIHCNLIYAADRALYLTGEYEVGASRLMGRALGPGWRYIDIGANVGKHAIPAAFAADEVLCFEPNPATRALLLDNLALNDLTNVRVLPFGLSDEETEAALYQNGLDIGGASLQAMAHDQAYPVRVVRGDEVVPRSDKRTYIKIDVEGHELQALRGLAGVLSAEDTVVQAEVTDEWLKAAGGGAQELFDFMQALGYRAFALSARTLVHTDVRLERLWAPRPDRQYDVIFARFERPEQLLAWLSQKPTPGADLAEPKGAQRLTRTGSS